MAEIANNNQITQLLALSDEINSVNLKIKQLVEELHSTSQHIGNLKSLTDILTNKAGAINNEVMGYTPGQTPDSVGIVTPSWESEGAERERIVPTPENQMQYVDMDIPKAATKREPLPSQTIAEMTRNTEAPQAPNKDTDGLPEGMPFEVKEKVKRARKSRGIDNNNPNNKLQRKARKRPDRKDERVQKQEKPTKRGFFGNKK